jgi:hypothetical protein
VAVHATPGTFGVECTSSRLAALLELSQEAQ